MKIIAIFDTQMQTGFITYSGAWKLGGFGFVVAADQVLRDPNVAQPFNYLVSIHIVWFV